MASSAESAPSWYEEFVKANATGEAGRTSSKDTRGPAERRRYPRFTPDQATASLRPEGLLSVLRLRRARSVTPVDLSEGGAKLLSPGRVPVGARARFKVVIEKFGDAVECWGTVRWCNRAVDRKADFYLGVMFVDLDTRQSQKLRIMSDWYQSPQYRALRDLRKSGGGESIALSD